MSIIKYDINILFRTVVGFNILFRIRVCELDVTKTNEGGRFVVTVVGVM